MGLIYEAHETFEDENYDKAIVIYEKLSSEYPTEFNMRTELIIAYLRNGDLEKTRLLVDKFDVVSANKFIEILLPLVDLKELNNQTLTDAMFLNLAYARAENSTEKQIYFDFVCQHEALLEVDEVAIWRKIKESSSDK